MANPLYFYDPPPASFFVGWQEETVPQFSETMVKTVERFACHVENCGRTYAQKWDLKIHILRIHGPEHLEARPDLPDRRTKVGKKYLCQMPGCPSGFKRKGDYNRHMKVKHLEE